MGNAAGEAADGFHFLALAQLFLEAPALVLGAFALGQVGADDQR